MCDREQQILACFTNDMRATLDDFVVWSFRYFLGRRTIATCCFARGLAKAWPLLNPRKQALIRRELDEAFRQDDSDRNRQDERPFFATLGDDCDRAAWATVRAAYQEEPDA